MTDEQQFANIVQEIVQLFAKKNDEYAGSYKHFGLKGRVSRLGERTFRLRKLVWEKEQLESADKIEDNLKDMAVEAVISLMCLRENNFHGIG